MTDPAFYPLSESAIVMEFDNLVSPATIDRIRSLGTAIFQAPFPGFVSAVPAYATLTVLYDPAAVIMAAGLTGADCFSRVANHLRDLVNRVAVATATGARVEIPVCYEGAFAPDLEELARPKKLTRAEVIHLHSAATYQVAMIGFVPGFAYLSGLAAALECPRKDVPRPAVPAGSVGIAGVQTGIYPLETPGGWQIIGRTPLHLFRKERPLPALLQAGDQVVFRPISKKEFEDAVNDH